jgi:glyoxylase-like metal-dependent hydrolase (beta-lactamase superfamily II)
MAEVTVLVEGYTSQKVQGRACATITLIKDKDVVMVVDPGCLADQSILVDALKKGGLKIEDVNWVCITHSHLDHYRNIGMFPKAKALDYWGIWEEDKFYDYKEKFTPDMQIIKTPGHDYSCITLLVKTSKGIIAVAGDLFWEAYAPKQDPYASDKIKLEENRKKILELSDWIVPGHGKMFKVKK